MKTNNPLLLLLTIWFALWSLPTTAQRSPTHARHTHSTHHRRVRHRATVQRAIKVWVNTNSGVYHYPGQRWYGNTKEGEYMPEDEARKRGYRPTENGQ